MHHDCGFFITIEGGEGTGKSTLAGGLFDYLTKQEKRVVLKSFEPGGTPMGQEIRKILLHREEKLSPRSELFLFLADRAHHVDSVIRPALAEEQIVIVDRFTDSSIAYQGSGRKLCELSFLKEVCHFAAGGLVPDITFFLDLDPENGLLRIQRQRDRIEGEALEFHKRVRQGYLDLAKKEPHRIQILDASQSKEEVYEEALRKLKKAMQKKQIVC